MPPPDCVRQNQLYLIISTVQCRKTRNGELAAKCGGPNQRKSSSLQSVHVQTNEKNARCKVRTPKPTKKLPVTKCGGPNQRKSCLLQSVAAQTNEKVGRYKVCMTKPTEKMAAAKCGGSNQRKSWPLQFYLLSCSKQVRVPMDVARLYCIKKSGNRGNFIEYTK
jgi:hypothetical protein